jgi:hypothetical protein
MKFIGLKRFAALSLLLISSSCEKEKKIVRMDDPIMGLSFEPAKVKFDSFPRALDSRKNVVEGSLKIFAKCVSAPDTFYIISCLLKPWNDQSGAWEADSLAEPDYGSVEKVTGTKDSTLGVPDGLFGKDPILPKEIVACLMDDAAHRYIQAFGGKQQLQEAVNKQNVKFAPQQILGPMRSAGISFPEQSSRQNK